MRNEKVHSSELVSLVFYFSSIGFSTVSSIFVGVFAGLYLDRILGTSYLMMFVFMFLGVAAGLRNLGLAIKKSTRL